MSLLKQYEPMGFDKWFSTNQEDLNQEFLELPASKRTPQDCDYCDGAGHVECNMNHDHECDDCDGKGQVAFVLRDYAMDEYRTQVSRDKVRIANYDAFMKYGVTCPITI